MLVMTSMLFAVQKVPQWARYILYLCLICIISSGVRERYVGINNTKIPSHYLSLERAKIYANNPTEWFTTVEETTKYLLRTLKPGEKFFALPYDPLYYYLTDRRSPTRQLIFFEHINIPRQQELSIIQELENQKVNYVLLSSRASATEPGIGEFGKTYCSFIKDYLDKNFKEVARFGNWSDDPGWAWNHGVKILKRIHHL